MSKNVFANGNEISAKQDGNKSIAAMADVCLSPPSPPAGPIPIPYPNSAKASDTSDGSKSVKIGGQEVGLKNKSCYKKSNGDEAATKSLGMGVVSHNIQGPMKHAAWSMDVVIEGQNAIRNLDLTTHNHSNPPQPAVTVDAATIKASIPPNADCDSLQIANKQLTTPAGQGRGNQPPRPGPPNSTLKQKVTVTTARFEPPTGSGKSLIACSRKQKDPWAQGAGPKGKSNMCGNYDHADGTRPNSSHTEARIVEDLFGQMSNTGPGGPGSLGSVTMRIQWGNIQRNGVRQPSNKLATKPCDKCRELICHAEKCGLEINICAGEPGQKKKVKCPPSGDQVYE